ncbi:thiolase family protein [Oceanobacillus sp. FSL H7-0719]|uniref:thiolase family protein n=1 Tax=Oceanobacillus sp. FSL H7-0719 TaxID=2954507 RepID=UPI0032537DBF
MKKVYILDGARTALTAFGGSFAGTAATKLGTVTANEALKRAEVDPAQINHIVYGNVISSETNAAYIARHIGLEIGVPQRTPAFILNRLCGSGLQAIISGAQEIMLSDADYALVGGVENMSQAPYSNFDKRFGGAKIGELKFHDMLQATLFDEYTGFGMGVTAENLAEKYTISREEQDEFAVLSHQRAAKAQSSGRFAEEIVPVEVESRRKITVINQDEHLKPETTAEKISKLRPSFKKDGTVTAANASGINDGAASLIIAGEDAVQKNNLNPLAEIVSWAVAGVDPNIMGIGPVPAIQQALNKANLSLDDMDIIEVNEAFAAQYLAVEKELGLDREKTNVNGGAIALGHPVGVSGARIALSAAYELRNRNKEYAVVSLCIGGGQGIAMVIRNKQ